MDGVFHLFFSWASTHHSRRSRSKLSDYFQFHALPHAFSCHAPEDRLSKLARPKLREHPCSGPCILRDIQWHDIHTQHLQIHVRNTFIPKPVADGQTKTVSYEGWQELFCAPIERVCCVEEIYWLATRLLASQERPFFTDFFFKWWRVPQQTLRTHRSLEAYCATLWWRWRWWWWLLLFVLFLVMEHRWNEIDRRKPKYS
jgi:hypothetical protein